MACLHLAQIAYLSQQLIESVANAQNLAARNKFELDRVQQTVKSLLTICDAWIIEEKESDDVQ